MGILNVTPDSFWEGGRWADPEAAVTAGVEMIAEGASVIDVGGESSRPGAAPVAVVEELRRVIPVVAALSPRVRVSVDTVKPAVATAAIEAGATLVNDISASLAPLAAEAGVGWVAMHMRGTPLDMARHARYCDVVSEVCDWLAERAEWGARLGLAEIWVDPGIGFAKTHQHNWELLGHLDRVVGLGLPVLVGTSRKAFLGSGSPSPAGGGPPAAHASPSPASGGPADRLAASLATAGWAVDQGAQMVRVHDVRATVQALRARSRRVSSDLPGA